MINKELEEFILEDNMNTPYYDLLNIETVDLEEGLAKAKFVVKSELTNPYKSLHGGAIASLADMVMGVAIRTTNRKAVTVNFNIDYLAAGELLDTIIAEGEVIKNGKNLIFTEAQLYKERTKKIIARAKGTFMAQGPLLTD
ncbi:MULTISPECIES: PaaI family thioesterase [unclassified Candidatus Frackibacter]|uniref:PaaI family thioesterase n=2 Tax=Candidatus Frackibacter TaxID=2017975 RepID=UPI0008D2FE41|nr:MULTISPECIES: PaaI family thioesterase [unclassified Candidatus Frackibacter]SEN03234.1 acyl-CoA thioesterase [Candidatus Frackibacter sp. WG12]SFM11282.1 acyl-CoA thioesterase [Candidatus Frackibacter sp. WG13]